MSNDPSVNQPPNNARRRRSRNTLRLRAEPSNNEGGIIYPTLGEIYDGLSPLQLERFQWLYYRVQAKPTSFPVFDELRRFGNYIEIIETLMTMGIWMFVNDDPGSYPLMVMEFLATLKVDLSPPDGRASAWWFKLGGIQHHFEREELCNWIGISPTGAFPIYDEANRQDFWLDIASPPPHGFGYPLPASLITDTYWKVLHRIVATVINVREGEGEFVTKEDLNILLSINAHHPPDWFTILSKVFEKYVSRWGNQIMEIGGGSIITRIAFGIGYVVNPATHGNPSKSVLNFVEEGEDIIMVSSSSENEA